MKILFQICLIGLICLIPSEVLANEKFSASQDITYKIEGTGNTKVTQNIHIKNLTTESLAKEFSFKIKNAKIKNLEAYDQTGALVATERQIQNGIEIQVTFRKLTPGIGNTLHWSLSYETQSLAKKVGRLWKITLPKPAKISEFDEITTGLYVPQSFGILEIAKPQPTTKNNIWSGPAAKNQILTVFTKPNPKPYQAYDFNLGYHLENNDTWPKDLEIALPPDTNYQKVFFKTITPKPETIRVDKDGNWLAAYTVSPHQTTNIVASGNIAVFTHPGSSNKKIAAIYYYTISKTKVTAICTEFTNLFVTLAKRAGFKAREINGYAVSVDKNLFPLSLGGDILHAWPEYYDPDSAKWIMVDPTWEKTSSGVDYFNSFDFDHVTLAIHGQNKTFPKPAGFYKVTTKLKKFISSEPPQKDVNIKPVDKDLPIDSPPAVLSKPAKITPWFLKLALFLNSPESIFLKMLPGR